MKRTGFARKPDSPFSSFANRATAERRAKKRNWSRKPTVADGSKYLAACRDEPCYLRVPGVCRLNPCDETVVPCHSNQGRDGKAGGLKADNRATVPGCFWCHDWIDQNRAGTPKQLKFDTWDRAYERWAPVRARKMGITEEVECSL
ncbi:nuclease domain-containing protein [Paraburkholderia sp. J12]|uniref:nuclease domain-containing protein n=1 Tax=Paraburkholderia sp. J12 TaxID=2805432 RepID=UPI002ABE871A|nr:nuclease domain-containing protein [Paraburkholderia sp. J12]